jgi:hypothetical protein
MCILVPATALAVTAPAVLINVLRFGLYTVTSWIN